MFDWGIAPFNPISSWYTPHVLRITNEEVVFSDYFRVYWKSKYVVFYETIAAFVASVLSFAWIMTTIGLVIWIGLLSVLGLVLILGIHYNIRGSS